MDIYNQYSPIHRWLVDSKIFFDNSPILNMIWDDDPDWRAYFSGSEITNHKATGDMLDGEFLSTGMVELGIVGVSAITMNHNDGYWIYYDLLWFLHQNAGWKRLFFYPTTPGIPGEDTWDFRLCPVDLPAIFTAPWPFRHCGRLHGKIHENPPLLIDDFPIEISIYV